MLWSLNLSDGFHNMQLQSFVLHNGWIFPSNKWHFGIMALLMNENKCPIIRNILLNLLKILGWI